MHIPTFDTRADKEVIPVGLPSPVTSGDVTGVEANHSSQVMSLDSSQNVQWNDDEISPLSQGHLDPGGYDPNMSGPHPTQEIADVCAGGMTGMLGGMYAMDSAEDYNAWIQYPSGSAEAFGADSVSPQGSFEHSGETIAGIPVYPVTRRA